MAGRASAKLFAQVLKRGGHGLLKGRVRAHRAAELLGGQVVGERLCRAAEQSVPITNYGIAIAQMHGILDRALQPFSALVLKTALRKIS